MGMDPNLKERLLFLVSPKKGNEAYNRRIRREEGDNEERSGPARQRMSYGSHGASRTLNSLIGWITGGGSAEDDIDKQGYRKGS